MIRLYPLHSVAGFYGIFATGPAAGASPGFRGF
jgi:hypothetical protein